MWERHELCTRQTLSDPRDEFLSVIKDGREAGSPSLRVATLGRIGMVEAPLFSSSREGLPTSPRGWARLMGQELLLRPVEGRCRGSGD